MRPVILRHILSSSLFATFKVFTRSNNIKNSYCFKKLSYTKCFTVILFILMVMALFLTVDARPLRHHSSVPSSSSSSSAFQSSENSFEIDEDAFHFTTRFTVLRRRSGASTTERSTISTLKISSVSELAQASTTTRIVPIEDKSGDHSFRYNLAEDELSTSYQRSSSSGDISSLNNERLSEYSHGKSTSSSFRDRARDAFLRLDSKPFVESTLLPEEQRRQIWLERHRQRKLERKKYPSGKNGELIGHRRLLTLTNADLINSNHTCTGDLFKHKVRMAGCEPKIIINRFCHGSCASFFIPELRSKKLKATFQSCAACVPIETDLTQVRLDCPDREEKVIYRTVMRVKRCACRNIHLDDDEDQNDEV